MHTIFETDCFVLKSTTQGEANKQIDLFTEKFGLIRATAQGVRYLKSKLRYSLTDFSFAHVSLVRGKEFWRITTASKKGDVSSDIGLVEGREALLRIFALLRRLLQGEEAHPELFLIVKEVFEKLCVLATPAENALNDILPRITCIEEVTVLRVLFLLGYVGDSATLRPLAETSSLDDTTLQAALELRKTIIVEINRALQASNL